MSNSNYWPVFTVQILIKLVTRAACNGNVDWNACRGQQFGARVFTQGMEINPIHGYCNKAKYSLSSVSVAVLNNFEQVALVEDMLTKATKAPKRPMKEAILKELSGVGRGVVLRQRERRDSSPPSRMQVLWPEANVLYTGYQRYI